MITGANLWGVAESARLFFAPTVAFIVAIAAVIIGGLVRSHPAAPVAHQARCDPGVTCREPWSGGPGKSEAVGEEREVSVGGIRLAYRVSGAPDAAPILLIRFPAEEISAEALERVWRRAVPGG